MACSYPFGFWIVATFIVDMIKGFTTGYLVELNVSFAHVFETGAIRPFLDFFLEFFSFLILVGCIMAVFRRFVIRPDQLQTEEEDITTLLFILFLELSGFFIQGYRIAHPEVVEARVYMANFTPASANNWISFAGYFLLPISERYKNQCRLSLVLPCGPQSHLDHLYSP